MNNFTGTLKPYTMELFHQEVNGLLTSVGEYANFANSHTAMNRKINGDPINWLRIVITKPPKSAVIRIDFDGAKDGECFKLFSCGGYMFDI